MANLGADGPVRDLGAACRLPRLGEPTETETCHVEAGPIARQEGAQARSDA